MADKTGRAKANCYHPASGLYLTEGETYTVDEAVWSDEVFAQINEGGEQ